MSTMTLTPLGLAQIYAPFFIEDFAMDVMNHLGGSYPIPTDVIKSFVQNQVETLVGDDMFVVINGQSAITRFLFECAEYVINHETPDPESRETYERIAQLPSAHHGELKSAVFAMAALYRKTLETTLLSVVARDATTATQTIQQIAQTRIAGAETGGNLNFFNWGILSDGLWLNAALLRANDLASIFKPGDPVVAYYTTVAFDFARQYTSISMLDEETLTAAYGELGVLTSHADADVIEELVSSLGTPTELNSFLFVPGVMMNYLTAWEKGLTNPTQLIWAVSNLTTFARLLSVLIETAKNIDEEELISDLIRNRLDQAYKVVTLVLAGYEALRETRLAETLILQVVPNGNDPTVAVYINNDLINTYHAMGGDDADLIRFGLYLDPRKGVPTPSDGWKISFINQRKADVIPTMIAEDNDRLAQLRSNDAAVIQSEAMRIIMNLVDSYLAASKYSLLRPDISQNITTLARSITSDQTEVSTDEELIKILVSVIDDPYLTAMTKTFFDNLSSGEEFTRVNAIPLTIAATAVNDVHTWIGSGIPVVE